MLGGDQTITISARERVRADACDAFAFLATPSDHRRLQVPGIRVLSLDGGGDGGALSGGAVALEGPLGIRRIARTLVTLRQSPCRIAGSARLDSGTEAHVSWTLRPADGALEVELTAVLGPVATADRLMLALGGRRWVQGRFAQTLRRLAAELERAPAGGHAVGRAAVAARGGPSRRVTQPA
jgi:Polyketide cyclase / dehydrase and lipid transport